MNEINEFKSVIKVIRIAELKCDEKYIIKKEKMLSGSIITISDQIAYIRTFHQTATSPKLNQSLRIIFKSNYTSTL